MHPSPSLRHNDSTVYKDLLRGHFTMRVDALAGGNSLYLGLLTFGVKAIVSNKVPENA